MDSQTNKVKCHFIFSVKDETKAVYAAVYVGIHSHIFNSFALSTQ